MRPESFPSSFPDSQGIKMVRLKFGAGTDVGKTRSHNEDSFRAEPELGLWLVADGMGGHRGGETASALAADWIVDGIRSGEPLARPISQAHVAILQATREGKGPEGMGTTVVALKAEENRYEIAWVGDCRAYLWDGNSLRQVTKDHSYVQYLVDKGIISADDIENHPQQNFIMQALGSTEIEAVEVDTIRNRFHRGEKILLCSDGLIKELTDNEIAEVLARNLGDQETVDLLIRMAVEHGGNDNITAIIVSAGDQAPPKMPRDFMRQDVREVWRYLVESLSKLLS